MVFVVENTESYYLSDQPVYKKGNRPSWLRAAKHEISVPLYEEFCKKLSDALGKPVGTGEFGADMKVELLNDGPVTIMMDTHNKE